MVLQRQAKKLRLRIATQRDMDRSIARVKRKGFHSVTKLFHITAEGKQECTTQRTCHWRV